MRGQLGFYNVIAVGLCNMMQSLQTFMMVGSDTRKQLGVTEAYKVICIGDVPFLENGTFKSNYAQIGCI